MPIVPNLVERQILFKLKLAPALMLGDDSNLPLATMTFDGVICSYAMLAIPDWRGALSEAVRVLKLAASFARAHERAGLKVSLTHRMKLASIASTTSWHMSARVATTVRRWWMPALRLAGSQPLDAVVQRLNANMSVPATWPKVQAIGRWDG